MLHLASIRSFSNAFTVFHWQIRNKASLCRLNGRLTTTQNTSGIFSVAAQSSSDQNRRIKFFTSNDITIQSWAKTSAALKSRLAKTGRQIGEAGTENGIIHHRRAAFDLWENILKDALRKIHSAEFHCSFDILWTFSVSNLCWKWFTWMKSLM